MPLGEIKRVAAVLHHPGHSEHKGIPTGKSSKNNVINTCIFPLKVKDPGIVRIVYSYYGPLLWSIFH